MLNYNLQKESTPLYQKKSPGHTRVFRLNPYFCRITNPLALIMDKMKYTGFAVVTGNEDGLVFENLHFEDWSDGISEVHNKFETKVYPNPTVGITQINRR